MRSFPIRWGDVGAEMPVELAAEEPTRTVLTGAHLSSAVLRIEGPNGKVELSLSAPGTSAVFPADWIHVWTSADFEKFPNKTARYVAQAYGVRVGGGEMRTIPTEGDLEVRIGRMIA